MCCGLCAVSHAVNMCVGSLFVIECKVKGTQRRDGGAAVN